MIIWLYGQPGSGKTTIANIVAPMLNAQIIDGDAIRNNLLNFDYSIEGRKKQNQSIIDIAMYLDYKKNNVVIASVAPYKHYRDLIKKTHNALLINLYCKSIRGREKYFVENFEEPDQDDIKIDTSKHSIQETVDIVLKNVYL
jgi:adenylylsulfate kinase-like enzyme